MSIHSTQGSVVIHRIRTGKDGRDAISTYLTVSPTEFALDAEGKIKGSKTVSVSAWKRVASGSPAKVSDNDVYITVTANQKNGTVNKGYKTTQKADLAFDVKEDFVSYVIDLYDGTAKSNLLDSKTVRIGAKDAIDNVRVDLDNENDTILYDGAGNKLSDDVVSHITLYDGVTQYTGSPVSFVVPNGGWSNCEGTLKGNTITVTKLTGDTASVTIHATYKNKVYPAILSLKRLVGVDKYDLVVGPNAVAYNTTKNSVLSGGAITVQVYRTPANGGTRHVVQSLSTYNLAIGCSVSNILGTYANGKATVTVNATTANANANVILTLTKDGVSQDSETIPITKSTDGDNAIRLDLDNENDSILYDGAGNRLSDAVVTHAILYDGGTAYTGSPVTFSIPEGGKVNCEASITGNTVTVTKLTDTTAKVIIHAYYATLGKTYEAVFSIKKLVGVDKYDLDVSPNSIAYNSSDGSNSGNTVTVRVWRTKQNGTRENIESLPTGYKLLIDGTNYATTYKNNKGYYSFTASVSVSSHSIVLTDGTNTLDSETIPVLKVKNGTSPYKMDLTNENTMVNCDYSGNPLSGAKYETSKVQISHGISDGYSDFTISVTADGITHGYNTSTHILNPSAITKDVATITVTATGKSGTEAAGITLSAVMTISKNKSGKPGESPVMFSLIPTHGTIRKDKDTNTFTDTTMSFKVLKVEGTTETMLDTYAKLYTQNLTIYCDGVTDAINKGKTSNAAITIDCATYFTADHKEFVLKHNGNEVDREGIDCVYDGQTGGPGANGFSYMLAVNNASIPFGSDGLVGADSFYGYAYKLTPDGGQTAVDLTASGNQVRLYYNAGYTKALNGYSYGYFYGENILKGIKLTRQSVIVQLLVNNKVVASSTVLVMLPGADGYQYLPINNGLYSSDKEYVWNAEKRDFIDYQFEGTWMRFGVAEYGKTVKGAVPTTIDKAGDGNWKVVEESVITLLMNTVFATNANLGGFLASAQRFISTQIAYYIRYLGDYSQNTAYEYVEPNIINALSAPRLDMVLYNSNYWVPKYVSQWVYRYRGTYSASATYEYVTADADNGLSVSRIDIVYYNSQYWILKAAGTCSGQTPSSTSSYWRLANTDEKFALETPSVSSNFWRLATTEEKKCADYGINVITEMRKLELNGENGIIKLLHSNGYKWEVTTEGIQILGVDSGRHLEIDPNEREFRIYDDDGTLSVKLDGETLASLDDIFSGKQSPTISFTQASYSNQSQGKGYIGNTTGQADKTEDTLITSSFQTTSRGKITIKGTLGARSNEKYVGDGSNIDGSKLHSSYDVPVYKNGYYYLKNVVTVCYLIKSYVGGKYKNTIVDMCTSDGNSSWITRNVSREVVLPAGTHYIYIRAVYHLQEGTSNWAFVRWSGTTATFVYDYYQSRIFANGLVFGSSVENFFGVSRKTNGDMEMRMVTNSIKKGFDCSPTNGIRFADNKNWFKPLMPIMFLYCTTANGSYMKSDGTSSGTSKVDGGSVTIKGRQTFDNSTFSTSVTATVSATTGFVKRIDVGVYQIKFPTNWSVLNLSLENTMVKMIGIYSVNYDPTPSCKLYSFDSTQLTFVISDDASRENRNYAFQILLEKIQS